MSHFERLSALDASFLEIETPRSSMAVGAVCVFAGGELVDATGAVDAARVRAYIGGAIARLPRYRQRMVRVRWIEVAAVREDAWHRVRTGP